MSINSTVLAVIALSALVTVIPRILPFLLVRNLRLPDAVMKWLSFVPVCILTALVIENLLMQEESRLAIDWPILLILLPTAIIAYKYRSLSMTVVSGVLLMAIYRYIV
ncbi:branched-chain amino acid transporter AzlD [Terribacillus saccharophilus]|uniref:AzlD domain-containing protein n=1 Tax=Terribacillus saccharophilus TaxID=361277 RepID=UPI000BA5CF26|nr:AzlD domain-containing protein [Terribacillus saccharophilus]PAF21192.1 branched-chain amino acid transporter AzlD [Terribacillus saccharophilus]PAF36498.1 branched-chain amino acid transporter AzlD [Terribacillus saccharophilus]PAF36546.1 branched-chain amino acid transporter AzlD [Terribacillus saccharophilus]